MFERMPVAAVIALNLVIAPKKHNMQSLQLTTLIATWSSMHAIKPPPDSDISIIKEMITHADVKQQRASVQPR